MSHGSEFLDQVMQLSSVVSQELKHWADQEFGGVRAAFRVLDKEGTGGHRRAPETTGDERSENFDSWDG